MSSTVIIVLIMNGGDQKYLCNSQTCFSLRPNILLPYLESSTHHVAGLVLSLSWTAFFAECVSVFCRNYHGIQQLK